jgi:23S rRNA (guanosine2251-2'-O)-methyltransferase
MFMSKEKTKKKPTELIFGAHPLVELLKAKKRRLLIIYTTKPEPKAWSSIEPLLPKGMQIQYVKREVLNSIAETTDHQGVVGFAAPFIVRKKFFDPQKEPFLIMLDGIQDPRNLGAILRSAYCTNVSGVIITQRATAPLSAAALKASAGLAEYLDIYIAPSAKAATQLLQNAGYQLYLAVLEKGENAAAVPFKSPLCLVIGCEETGISRDIRDAGIRITLPQKRADISYNASVASGILLFLIAHRIGAIL